ncbi:hypothetical protein GCM10009602_17700 [Nocardiopsis tropica]
MAETPTHTPANTAERGSRGGAGVDMAAIVHGRRLRGYTCTRGDFGRAPALAPPPEPLRGRRSAPLSP